MHNDERRSVGEPFFHIPIHLARLLFHPALPSADLPSVSRGRWRFHRFRYRVVHNERGHDELETGKKNFHAPFLSGFPKATELMPVVTSGRFAMKEIFRACLEDLPPLSDIFRGNIVLLGDLLVGEILPKRFDSHLGLERRTIMLFVIRHESETVTIKCWHGQGDTMAVDQVYTIDNHQTL